MKNKNKYMNMLKSSLLDLPTPSSISMMWNMGFMLGMVLVMQITTGLVLSMMYTPQTETAFSTMVSIMRDNNSGWATRIMHMNGASLFFMLMYIHIARGVYFSSPSNQKKVWMSGIMLMMLSMMTAFLGYVLPWGQMSLWGATVITGVLSAIPYVGPEMMVWIWGGPSVGQPTLNRFFSLHFLMPMLIMLLVMMHLLLLHEKGSSNPTNTNTNFDKIKFNIMFSLKDFMTLTPVLIFMMLIMSNTPFMMGDVENFNPANPMVAPEHIQPEWYFLFAYVILRSVPSKLGGVIAMVMSIMVLSIFTTKKTKSSKFKVSKKTKFWALVAILVILSWVGSKSVEPPFESIGQTYTLMYFLTILIFCFLQSPWKPYKESFLEN